MREVSIALGVEALALAGSDRELARRQLESVLDDGRARAAWDRLIVAHGGDPDPRRLAAPRRRLEVRAASAGRIVEIDGEALGWAAVDLGAGRRRLDDAIDHGAGLEIHARLGADIDRRAPLATLLLGDREVDVSEMADRTRRAFVIGDGDAEVPSLIVGTVDDIEG